ncbi:MAG TPA: InlB B-repeat-containing protein [Candidatus Onthoplasma faecipullorum]|nr:InlB B-repeat-containing protein [Candidatus Onthoplasma faecipullorum]
MTKKIIAIVVSILAITAIGCFVGLNWKSIKAMLSGAQIYTAEQMEESYNQGYADANTNEDTYLQQIDYYKNLVEDNELEIENLNNEITNLTNTNDSYQSQITNLNGIIEENENTIESLQSTISDNNTTISGLNTQISGLNNEIDSLESDIEDLQNELSQAGKDYQILQAELTTKTNQVISLQNQVNNLQKLVNQLNATNELNLTTISTLNSQIETLNSQISDLTYQINNNDSTVASLNNQIAQLQESISYYENYISNLESETQVVVTFEFDGSVYNIQIVNKGATVSVVNPTSTDYVQFNYWTINEEQIDLSSYTFNTNTKVVADVTYSYDVKFYVDNAVHNSQIIQSGNKATTPTVPTKTGYTFLGWSLNGSDIVDLSTVTITENTNFYALFVQQFTVQFVYEDDVVSTQTINNGAYATSPSVESTTYKVFNGWKVNGTSVDVETYKIVGATTFVADITYKYDVTFMVDDEEYDTQIVTSGQYATVPTAPTKDGYIFKGWSLNGSDIIDLSGNSITSTTTYYAVFEVLYASVEYDNSTSYYNNFNDAWNYACTLSTTSSKYPTLTLYKDIDAESMYNDNVYDYLYVPSGKYIELDLNGHIVTAQSASTYSILMNGKLTINDSIGTGSIVGKYIKANTNSLLVIDGGTINSYIDMIGYSSLYMNGGKIITASSNGAVYLHSPSSSISFYMTGGVITNTAGIGVRLVGSTSAKVNFTMSGGTISDCAGRGINAGGYTTVKISNGIIENNSGGGILVSGSSTSKLTTLTITGVTIQNNTASYGGGIYLGSCTESSISNANILNNTATTSGGGIYLNSSSSSRFYTTIESSIIQNNSAATGGGIYNGAYSSITSLQDVQIINNNATNNGGGLYSAYNSHTSLTGATKIINNTKGETDNNVYIPADDCTISIQYDFTGELGFTHKDGAGKVASLTSSVSGAVCTTGTYYSDITSYTISVDTTNRRVDLS